jgi:D-alanyl-D-alanine carboxypeptidase (penicillin-binding protein 5/6)
MLIATRRRAAGAVVLASSLTFGCAATDLTHVPRLSDPPRATPSPTPDTTVAWPDFGQASLALDGRDLSSPGQRPVPIASVAKVMTAYLVVHRMAAHDHLVVDAYDVADTRRRKGRGESVVEVAPGEVLTRDEALTALLLPSANNVAVMLAERVTGSSSAFVALMNETARELGMDDTSYTDPSGFKDSTVSTGHDQLLLLKAALRSASLARIMGTTSAVLPVAGRVRNTNSLLGRDGFVAGKTGSTSAAGGCVVFRVVRHGRVLDGVVLGQRGGRLIDAGLRAALDLARQALAP